MAGKDAIEVEGQVIDSLPNAIFRVELSNGHRLLARAEDCNSIPILPGDKVMLEVSPYDLSRGRITFRRQ